MKTKNLPTLKPLDFVRPNIKKNKIGIITEISSNICNDKIYYSASIEWIGGNNELKTAWWDEDEIKVVDSLPRLLSRELCHAFGTGKKYIDMCFPK